MVFDVESVGLHGEGFAVGWVVVNGYGNQIQHGLVACNPTLAVGNRDGRIWISQNLPRIESLIPCEWPRDVRSAFWKEWQRWRADGVILVADCAWPVEARFLAACVDDSPVDREWQGPYPLHDLGSILLAAGKDPLQKFPRKENEIPEHNPLADARQSARILIETLFPTPKQSEVSRTGEAAGGCGSD